MSSHLSGNVPWVRHDVEILVHENQYMFIFQLLLTRALIFVSAWLKQLVVHPTSRENKIIHFIVWLCDYNSPTMQPATPFPGGYVPSAGPFCWDIIPMASDCKVFRAHCQWSPLLPLSSTTNWMSAMRMSQKCTFGIFLGFPEIRRLSQSPARKACDVIVGRYVWIEILRMKLFVNRGFWF